jgi:hypothetical protein
MSLTIGVFFTGFFFGSILKKNTQEEDSFNTNSQDDSSTKPDDNIEINNFKK